MIEHIEAVQRMQDYIKMNIENDMAIAGINQIHEFSWNQSEQEGILSCVR
ncbi:MAG: hypothetical protein IKB01_01265 [Lachnospiraceae bacterium]|nr:hypothetical protein [Lachnospiraceae bacterium]MBR4084010.1 hypothetical protein [Lachnospiraceae bacterium]